MLFLLGHFACDTGSSADVAVSSADAVNFLDATRKPSYDFTLSLRMILDRSLAYNIDI